MDKERLKEVYRKEWVRFVKLDSKEACEAAVKQYLNDKKASLADFEALTGVDLTALYGCYIEYCGDETPVAPVLPGVIEPIISFRQDGAKVSAVRFGLKGLYHAGKDIAWIKTSVWEEVMGDQNYLEENLEAIVTGLEKAEQDEENEGQPPHEKT